MTKVVNLRQARKARARQEKAAKAADNRVRFGRSKAERRESALESEAAVRSHDGHRLERDDDTA
ncbi:MAG: DUF4169 family protein [Rhodovibrionaceae bacterium]